ncbi:MAG: lysophospholipid acyltransferase family protein [Anaerovoracaceae bacterium]|nr:lysophospholipid acyltransferase family protein [Anaerovoracaceae bacterium]
MIIIRNIPTIINLAGSLPPLKELKKEIDAARAAGDDETERIAIRKAEDIWGDELMRRLKIDLHVKGQENIPAEGPVVFVSNHQGYCDVPCFFEAIHGIQFGFIAKRSLGRVPFFGRWIYRIRSAFIDRKEKRSSVKAILEGIDNIKHGFSMVIFPEGTRARCSTMREFKPGAVKLAIKPGVPVVPVSINGTYNVYERYGVVKPARVDVMIHKPIETEGMTRRDESALTAELYEIIKKGVDELAAENPDSIFEPDIRGFDPKSC